MSSRPLLRKLLLRPRARQAVPQRMPLRFSSSESQARRIDRVLDRLPRFLHPYTSGLRRAPVTHVVSFLILHEITAIVPLVGLAGLFHWWGKVPDVLAEGSAVSEGVQKFGRYFARKGWFGFNKPTPADNTATHEEVEHMTADERIEDVKKEGWNVGENGRRILVEVASAYAITKVMLPARVILSVWATPWFARNVLGGLGRLFGRGSGSAMKGSAAGTGAIGAEAVGKASTKKIS